MPILQGHSVATDPHRAVEELHAAIRQPECAFVVFFCSSGYDLDAFAKASRSHFAGTPVIGCTTAGEIGRDGYRQGSLVGASFPSAEFAMAVTRLDDLGNLDDVAAYDRIASLRGQVPALGDGFALLLVDGLSGREERLARAAQAALGDLPLVGGSAGDDQHFVATKVFHDGRFHGSSAVVAVVSTSEPCKVFHDHQFVGGAESLVVTEADAAQRLVSEINGRPAALEYARAAGLSPHGMTPERFASLPLVVRINGSDYVRSIRQVNGDGSLTLYCAIERGVALRVARSLDVTRQRASTFKENAARVGAPQLTLMFDCIHCRLAAVRHGELSDIEGLAVQANVIGFSTYGEQFMGLHVNHTMTGVVIGQRSAVKHG